MITVLFSFGTDKVLITIDGKRITFANTAFGSREADITGIRLNYDGVIKEFPELEGDEYWEEEAIRRFKEKIQSFDTEDARAKYIIEDLKKFGYIPEQLQKEGFRPKRIK